MKKAWLLMSLLLLSAAPALAMGWVPVAVSENEQLVFFVDHDSLEYEDPYVTLWIKVLDNSGELIAGRKIWYSLGQVKVNCEARQDAFLQSTLYDENDQVLAEEKYDAPEWTPIVPDSMMDGVYDYVCLEKS